MSGRAAITDQDREIERLRRIVKAGEVLIREYPPRHQSHCDRAGMIVESPMKRCTCFESWCTCGLNDALRAFEEASREK